MDETGSHNQYATAAIKQYAGFDESRRRMFVDLVAHIEIKRVLDVGCGAGQMLLPFYEELGAFCIGLDAAEDVGRVAVRHADARFGFVRGLGECLPFASETFDLILCRLAIPYMDARAAIGEMSRVLRPQGVILLKTHALPFYAGMVIDGLKEFDPKRVAYPIICVAGGIFHRLSGLRLHKGFWRGKENFQTRRLIRNECDRAGLRLVCDLPDTNAKTPSYLIEKKSIA